MSRVWKKARKKPVIVQFREVKKKNLIRIKMPEGKEIWGEAITTREGTLFGYVGEDFIIRGVKGEMYPIKKDIFYETYEILKD